MGALPRRVMAAFARFNRASGRGASRGLLLAMAALLLVMPMSYRAGTAYSHPHAFFQVFIDAATGHSHHDAGELTPGSVAEPAGTLSSFVPPDVPLQPPAGTAGVHSPVVAGHILFSPQATSQASDTPALTALTAPLEQASGIPALSLSLLLLLAADQRRALWAQARAPRGVTTAPELPPPRLRAL